MTSYPFTYADTLPLQGPSLLRLVCDLLYETGELSLLCQRLIKLEGFTHIIFAGLHDLTGGFGYQTICFGPSLL